MSFLLGKLRRRLFRISPEEAKFAHRGFPRADESVRLRLERIGQVFIEGYHSALSTDKHDALAVRLNAFERDYRGFAFEGAGMGLSLLDCITPWRRNRLRTFLEADGAAHCYMMHVGAGWALARLSMFSASYLERLDPLLRWLAFDGYGFHEGYFHWPLSVERQAVPKHLSGYSRRAFDQGLGRSLWFVCGADVERISTCVTAFGRTRQADLWSGVGLACAYAGGATRSTIYALHTAAGDYRPHLAQGAAFAAKTRQRAGNSTAHTALACEVICGLCPDEAARITDIELENLTGVGSEPLYEAWRRRIRNHFRRDGERYENYLQSYSS